MNRYKYLNGYDFSGCAIRDRNILSFFGTKWEDKDALENRITGVFFYYPDEPKNKQWAYREIGLSTGIHGTAVFYPEERWIFMMDDGFVYVVGKGDDNPEAPVTNKKNTYFTNLKTISRMHAYAIGTCQKVFRRDSPNQWTKLDNGFSKSVSQESIGFLDIDGFHQHEIYACGRSGNLWIFDGVIWSKIDLPTNVDLRKICCSPNGLVYVMAGYNSFLIGRNNNWKFLDQNVTTDMFEQMVWYKDRIYISTGEGIFEIKDEVFEHSNIRPPKQNLYGNLASGDGILLVAGSNEACMFDGNDWKVILKSP
jgi:hypothetical protein